MRSRCARHPRRVVRGALRDQHAELNGGGGGDGPAPGGHEGGEDRLVERLMASEITFEEFEREILVRALSRTRGNQSRAARMLGKARSSQGISSHEKKASSRLSSPAATEGERNRARKKRCIWLMRGTE